MRKSEIAFLMLLVFVMAVGSACRRTKLPGAAGGGDLEFHDEPKTRSSHRLAPIETGSSEPGAPSAQSGLVDVLEHLETNETDIGNGGDAVFCKASPGSGFDGLYALDFILTFRKSNDNTDIRPVKSWEQSRARLSSLLRRMEPTLAQRFDAFVALIGNQDDVTQPRFWEEASFGLVALKDEKMLSVLPSNCVFSDAKGAPRLVQTVIRTAVVAEPTDYAELDPTDPTAPRQVTYTFNPTILKILREKYPLQYSFLIVHEWLWDYTRDVNVIRRVNRLLHSSFVEKMSSDEFATYMKRASLRFHTRLWQGVFVDAAGKCEIRVDKDPEDYGSINVTPVSCPDMGFGGGGVWYDCQNKSDGTDLCLSYHNDKKTGPDILVPLDEKRLYMTMPDGGKLELLWQRRDRL